MSIVYLISAQYIKDRSIINENVDNKYLNSTIVMCQDINLQQLLGSDLYNEIKTQVTASTLTAANTTLLNNYILPYLLNLVQAEIVIPATFKITNQSVVTKNSEVGSSVDARQLQMLKGQLDNQAQFYGERMRKYLLANTATYPLYLNGNTDIDDIRPENTAYSSGIFLGNTRRKGYRNRGIPPFTDRDNCCD